MYKKGNKKEKENPMNNKYIEKLNWVDIIFTILDPFIWIILFSIILFILVIL